MALIRTTDGDLFPNDIRLLSPRIDNVATATPLVLNTDHWVKYTNATTTGFSAPASSQVATLLVTNATGADFITGSWYIPNGSTWMLLFDGTSWTTLQGV